MSGWETYLEHNFFIKILSHSSPPYVFISCACWDGNYRRGLCSFCWMRRDMPWLELQFPWFIARLLLLLFDDGSQNVGLLYDIYWAVGIDFIVQGIWFTRKWKHQEKSVHSTGHFLKRLLAAILDWKLQAELTIK